MHRNQEGLGRRGEGLAIIRFGAGLLRLILDGVSARAHAIAGTHPSTRDHLPMSAVMVAEREGRS